MPMDLAQSPEPPVKKVVFLLQLDCKENSQENKISSLNITCSSVVKGG